jgi:hypothetical protein
MRDLTRQPACEADRGDRKPDRRGGAGPRIAWLTTGTFDRSFALAAENCRRLATGEALLHRVV